MTTDLGNFYVTWDWLPDAAVEVNHYLQRILTESAIQAHDVSARAKSIASFQRKCEVKQYENPTTDVTDIVAARIITYSVTDRDRVCDEIRSRFVVKEGEDRNPGEERLHSERGYDCHHFVVTGERQESNASWLTAGGALARYFDRFNGLEIQVRTVASHAWAEFEHARRYKGRSYDAISDRDKKNVNTLFAAAADARQLLDDMFVAIDELLAHPTPIVEPAREDTDDDLTVDDDQRDVTRDETAIDRSTLRDFLVERYPDDSWSSNAGLDFGCELLQACDFQSMEAVRRAMGAVDEQNVRELMEYPAEVSRVRRLDDDLLARFGKFYIERTSDIGEWSNRARQLESRYDRLRNKVTLSGYNTYLLVGEDCPDELLGRTLSGAKTVRQLIQIVGDEIGADRIVGLIDSPRLAEKIDLAEAEGRDKIFPDETAVRIARSMSRTDAEYVMYQLLLVAEEIGFDLEVVAGDEVLPADYEADSE